MQIRSAESRAAEVKRDAEKTFEAAVTWEKQRAAEEAALQVGAGANQAGGDGGQPGAFASTLLCRC